MNRLTTQLGPLTCHLVDDLPAGAKPSLLVVLCHGFGAPGKDLVPLGRELLQYFPALAPKVQFVFPEAPLPLHGFGFDARMWWEIDMERRLTLQAGGAEGVQRLREELPEGMPAARKQLMAALDALLIQTGLPWSKVVLGGFSQGSMITTDLTLRLDEPPAALVILSGTLMNALEWAPRVKARAGLRVFQSHGTRDPLLPYDNAVALKDLLTSAGLSVEFTSFPGEHTIGAQAFEKLGAFLVSLAA